jgi:hypothetical protein
MSTTIQIGPIEEIKLDTLPSSNFGPGVELLMNGRKKETAVEEISLKDIDSLEKELNDLSSPSAEAKNVFTIPPPSISAPSIKFMDVKMDEKKPEEKTKTWDGFRSFSAVDPDKEAAAPEMSKEEMLKSKFKFLRKLEEFEAKGVTLTKKYSMDSPLNEMQGEYENIVSEKERTNSIKFQGKMLMAGITAFEFLNSKFDPFDIKLDGWAEQVGENIEEYDDIFAELHDKYRSKAKMAPELKLLFQLAGGAVMLHMTNTMFKSAIPGMDDIMRQNPDLMQKFTQAAVSSMAPSNPGFSGFMSSVMPKQRAEMKGPSDISDILGGLKSKTIHLNDDQGSTVSLTELQEMKDELNMPKKSKKRVKSDKNSMTLDI